MKLDSVDDRANATFGGSGGMRDISGHPAECTDMFPGSVTHAPASGLLGKQR